MTLERRVESTFPLALEPDWPSIGDVLDPTVRRVFWQLEERSDHEELVR